MNLLKGLWEQDDAARHAQRSPVCGSLAASIYGLIFRRTMVPVAVGATIGVAAALASSGILASVLFGVSPLDPLGVGGSMLFVLAVALLAGGWAARRAARADPMVVLRYE